MRYQKIKQIYYFNIVLVLTIRKRDAIVFTDI